MTEFLEGVDKTITRRQFLNTASFTVGALHYFSYCLLEEKENGKPAIGLCGVWANAELAKNAGCAYIEAGVAKVLMPSYSDAEFKKQFEDLSLRRPLPAECFNVFLPRELKSVGVQANHEGIIQYASVAFKRAEIVGAKIIVFGSGG
jgi:hypothetical protein